MSWALHQLILVLWLEFSPAPVTGLSKTNPHQAPSTSFGPSEPRSLISAKYSFEEETTARPSLHRRKASINQMPVKKGRLQRSDSHTKTNTNRLDKRAPLRARHAQTLKFTCQLYQPVNWRSWHAAPAILSIIWASIKSKHHRLSSCKGGYYRAIIKRLHKAKWATNTHS